MTLLLLTLLQQAQVYNINNLNEFCPDSLRDDELIKTRFDIKQTSSLMPKIKTKKKYINWLLNENLISIEKENFSLIINPVLNLNIGFSKNDKSKKYYTQNTRGIDVSAKIGKKLFIHSDFYENQSYLIDYFRKEASFVVMGQGRTKPFKDGGTDFASSSASILYQINDNIALEFGNDKLFIGDGYRSLILSDCSFYYPFLKADFSYKNFSYQAIYTEYQNVMNSDNEISVLNKRRGQYNIFSYNLKNKLRLSVFEASLWNGKNFSSLPASFYLPIIGIKKTLYKFDDETNNLFYGLNILFSASRTAKLYTQVVIDDLSKDSTKYSLQFGSKFLLNHFFLQAELNYSKENTYNHYDASLNNNHFNYPLALPLSNDFAEIVLRTKYYKHRFLVDYKFSFARNSFSVYKDNRNFTFSDFKLSFFINPKTNLSLFINYFYRHNEKKSDILLFGIRTNLRREYRDF